MNQAGDITARTFVSNVASGTAPFTVTSTTKVTNLNADLLDGFNSDTAATVNTIALRDANGDLTARILKSNIATGTAPLTVTSTTVVTNLNADMVDGKNATDFVAMTSSKPVFITTATTATAGAAAALPATPVGYITITISSTDYKVPYYNV
jgi:hypothetical protein